MFFFFFSSRRRHTRFKCDWSSDVCSSDLLGTIRAKSIPFVVLTSNEERRIGDRSAPKILRACARPRISETDGGNSTKNAPSPPRSTVFTVLGKRQQFWGAQAG